MNEWKNDRWGILIGGRLDKHNMVDNVIFSPRANLRFNPTQNINLRLSYSSGFRAPQAFDEDMHIENVGGTVAMIERAKNLKEEKSQSFSASADMYHRFGVFQTNFLIEGFYTRLTDVFVLGEPYDRGDGILVTPRSNGPGAKVMGLTLEGKVAYLSILQIQAGLTLQRSRYAEPLNLINGMTTHRQKRKFSVLPIHMVTSQLLILPSNLYPLPCQELIPGEC